jgi:hypothetical protein
VLRSKRVTLRKCLGDTRVTCRTQLRPWESHESLCKKDEGIPPPLILPCPLCCFGVKRNPALLSLLPTKSVFSIWHQACPYSMCKGGKTLLFSADWASRTEGGGMFIHFDTNSRGECDGCGSQGTIMHLLLPRAEHSLNLCINCFGALAVAFRHAARKLGLRDLDDNVERTMADR